MARKFNKKSYKKKLDSLWSEIVRGRDKVCMTCGKTETLQAHHAIVRKGQSNSTRWDLENGVTMCYYCHICQLHALATYTFLKTYMQRLDIKIPAETKDRLILKKSEVFKDNQYNLELTMDNLLKEKELLTSNIIPV